MSTLPPRIAIEAAALEALLSWLDLTAERAVIVRAQDAAALTDLERAMGDLAAMLELAGIDVPALAAERGARCPQVAR